jgi:hypothetical protein
MFQMPRGKLGNVDNGFSPRRAGVVDSGGPAPVARPELDLSLLWRRKWWIAVSVAVALVVCFAPISRSRRDIAPPPKSSSVRSTFASSKRT